MIKNKKMVNKKKIVNIMTLLVMSIIFTITTNMFNFRILPMIGICVFIYCVIILVTYKNKKKKA